MHSDRAEHNMETETDEMKNETAVTEIATVAPRHSAPQAQEAVAARAALLEPTPRATFGPGPAGP